MENEVSWKDVEEVLNDVAPPDGVKHWKKELQELQGLLRRMWAKYFPTEAQINNLVDRQKALQDVQEQFQSFGERMANKLSEPFAVASTYSSVLSGSGTVLLAFGLTTAVTGGAVALGTLVLLPLIWSGYKRERADKWKKLQMCIPSPPSILLLS